MRGESTKTTSQLSRQLRGCCVYYAFIASMTFAFGALLPCIPVDVQDGEVAKWHHRIWRRDFLGVGDLLAWLAALAAGFGFVATVTCGRSRWYVHRRPATSRTIGKLMGLGIVTWPLGPKFFMASCTDYSERRDSIGSQLLSGFLWNSVYFALPYSIGLLFSVLDEVELLNKIVLEWRYIKQWDLRVISAFTSAAVAIISALSFQLYIHYTHGRLVYYSGAILGLVFLIACYGFYYRKTHVLHLHHYFLFGVLALLFASRHIFSVICFGICSGISVEVSNVCPLISSRSGMQRELLSTGGKSMGDKSYIYASAKYGEETTGKTSNRVRTSRKRGPCFEPRAARCQ
eukprot:gb/GECG01015478.1/.p1 GENE.gb/GECG01015478.1/~~gb/GECG01015478.1/.p1  ORF type:complete len:345 (+),score=-5.40 gb/GECG01015478.1/:1-1035(+)